MEINEKRRAFHTLDGLRGIAALIIVTRHIGPFASGLSFPESFLAVDMFFLLSGFVIAFAYKQRLEAGLSTFGFMKIRLIRLYPLYLLGLVIGLIYRLGSTQRGAADWSPGVLASTFAFGLLMLVQSPLIHKEGRSLDAPTWTLLPELLANLAYAAFRRFMTVPVLAAITLVGALGVIYSEFHFGTLDVGWRPHEVVGVWARLTFSFFLGILIFETQGDRRTTRNIVAWICLLLLGLFLLVHMGRTVRHVYELALVIVGFPAILVVASRSEPGPVSGRIFRFLGVISYGVYTLHMPLSRLINRLLARGHFQVETLGLLALPLFLVGIVVVAWLADEVYDVKVRRWLTARFSPRTARPALRPTPPATIRDPA